MRPGLHPSEGLTGPGGSTPKAVHSHGWLVGAAEWQVHPFLFTGQDERPHIMAAGFPQRKRSESKTKLQDLRLTLLSLYRMGHPGPTRGSARRDFTGARMAMGSSEVGYFSLPSGS